MDKYAPEIGDIVVITKAYYETCEDAVGKIGVVEEKSNIGSKYWVAKIFHGHVNRYTSLVK